MFSEIIHMKFNITTDWLSATAYKPWAREDFASGETVPVLHPMGAAAAPKKANLTNEKTLKKRISNIEQGISNVEVRYFIDLD
ncbi:hypothetical protein D1AOALGA4SA_3694 [Olavius algarvensis Delta 1 endosymbiont]|nr:hypothetical protein D1AOALGA4SA_3694 [Olavius algarvensis Delta 1 endosymbiont]